MLTHALKGLVGLDGRVVVIAGAGGGGMGTQITRVAASAGAAVLAVDLSQESLDKHIAPLVADGLPITSMTADVLKDDGIAAIIERTRKMPGELYGLVTVVGGTDPHWAAATKIPR